ncbi:MAG: hypothetical protein ACLFVU_02400 [Phycisphaerae bacterium]
MPPASQGKLSDHPHVTDGSYVPEDQQTDDTCLQQLRAAVRSGNVDRICSGYTSYRQSARGRRLGQLLRSLDNGKPGMSLNILTSAFSHRHCFMCESGVQACAHCKGKGEVEEYGRCPHCDGLGILPCGFCRGTGWADAEDIPSELRQAVLRRRLKHVRKELGALLKSLAGSSMNKLLLLPIERRKPVVAEMTKLQARLTEMVRLDLLGTDEQLRLGRIAAKLENCVSQIRESKSN